MWTRFSRLWACSSRLRACLSPPPSVGAWCEPGSGQPTAPGAFQHIYMPLWSRQCKLERILQRRVTDMGALKIRGSHNPCSAGWLRGNYRQFSIYVYN